MSSIPALSHLNTLFPASKSRPQRVPERPEPNRGETSMYRCSPSRGERVRGHWNPGTGRDGEQAGSATERGAHPLLTLLHLLCLPPHGVRSPHNALPAAEKRQGRRREAASSREGSIRQRS